jgi:hypothetical protein
LDLISARMITTPMTWFAPVMPRHQKSRSSIQSSVGCVAAPMVAKGGQVGNGLAAGKDVR